MVFLALLTLYLICSALVAAVVLQDRVKGRGRSAARGRAQRSAIARDAALDPHGTNGRDLVFRTQT